MGDNKVSKEEYTMRRRRPMRIVSSAPFLMRAQIVVLPSPLILRVVATVMVRGFVVPSTGSGAFGPPGLQVLIDHLMDACAGANSDDQARGDNAGQH